MEREKEKADHLSDIGIFPHLPAKKKVAARLRYVVAPRESVLMVHYWFLSFTADAKVIFHAISHRELRR